jgi:Tim44-like domain
MLRATLTANSDTIIIKLPLSGTLLRTIGHIRWRNIKMFVPKSRIQRFFLTLVLGFAAVVALHLLTPSAVLAAPGGKIASAIFRSFWGRILLAILCIIFLPLIIYISAVECLAERRTLKDLKRLSQISPKFDWLQIEDRVTECFHQVHSAWRKEDMQRAVEWMTDWYWQNQQIAYLDRWEQDGLVNHCRVRNISSIRPLFIRFCEREGSYDDSRLVVAITANMEDYLAERQTGKVVQGKKGYTDVTSLWTFLLVDGRWVVANIEQDTMTTTYAKMANEIPELLLSKNLDQRL